MFDRMRLTVLILLVLAAVFTGGVWGDTGEAKENPLLPQEYDVWSCNWSPDGSRVVFSGKIKGEDSTRMRTWLWTPPAGAPVLFTNTASLMDSSPSWSPAGDSVLMVRRSLANGEPNGVGISSSLWLKSLRDGAGVQLTSGHEDRDPAWSPQGKSLVFIRGEGPYVANLFIVDHDGKNLRQLTKGSENLLAFPSWGSDGWIYYTRFQIGRREITVNAQKYSTLEIEKGNIERINPDTGKIETVVKDEYDNRAPAVSPDGRYLAFISTRGALQPTGRVYDRGALVVMDLKDQTIQIQVLSDKAGLNGTPPAWSPKGDSISYFSFRNIRPSLWVVPFNKP